MANNSLVLSTFIKQLDECLEDIIKIYPDTARDSRFLKCKMYFDALKKGNPKMMIHLWKTRVNDVFRDKIDAKDLNFFIEFDYRKEVVASSYTDEIDVALNDLRSTIRVLSQENIDKTMHYIQNLCKLGDMYLI